MNRSSFVSKLFTPVITLLVLAYFGYQIYGYVSDPFSTTLAYTYQVEDTVDISGYVVRQEQVLTGDTGGLMRLRKNEGERVGTGGAVATVYADQASLDRQNEIETLNNRIEQLEYAQESMLGGGHAEAGQPDRPVPAGLPDRRGGGTAGRSGEPGAGTAVFGPQAGLYLFRHRGSQRTAAGTEKSVENPAVSGC